MCVHETQINHKQRIYLTTNKQKHGSRVRQVTFQMGNVTSQPCTSGVVSRSGDKNMVALSPRRRTEQSDEQMSSESLNFNGVFLLILITGPGQIVREINKKKFIFKIKKLNYDRKILNFVSGL